MRHSRHDNGSRRPDGEVNDVVVMRSVSANAVTMRMWTAKVNEVSGYADANGKQTSCFKGY